MASLLALISMMAIGRPEPDTLIVCPVELRSALDEWKEFRRSQGHEILDVHPPTSASQLNAVIRRVGASGTLKYIVLIGDVPSVRPAEASRHSVPSTPTMYVPAKVNVRWGSERLIATDIPYADLDGDGLPDLAIGRIPARTVSQLSAVLRKSIDYERKVQFGPWQRRVNIASCNGGFGAITDALIAAAARQIITQNVPAEYITQHISPDAAAHTAVATPALSFAVLARRQINEGSLAWVYLGHGRPTELDHVPTPTGTEPVLCVGDVSKLRCRGHNPVAVLVACYTGAMDATDNCLAEELLLAPEGPVAVLAATRVTMPYGNTVLGCELLRACFQDRPEHLGDTLRIAQRKTLAPLPNDQLRKSLDSMASGISPVPVDLVGERQEHVMMYHLFGDPLLHLQYARTAARDEANPVADR